MSRLRAMMLALVSGLLLGGCGIANDSVPRDIDPATLEPLAPQP